MNDENEINNTEFVNLLYRAKRRKDLSDFQPSDFLIEIDSHSTAVHVSIYMTSKSQSPLKVWYKTNWEHSQYEFNEKGKTRGVQDGCSFIKPTLLRLFRALLTREALLSQEHHKKLSDDQNNEKASYQSKVEHYRELHNKNN